jgi:tripartite motif-containing protein 71
MNRKAAIAGTCGAVALLVGCGHPPKPKIAEPTAPVPVTLAVDSVIQGVILGQELSQPSGLVVDSRGDLVLVDAGNNRIVRFAPTLAPERELGGYGTSSGLFSRPTFLTADGAMGVRVVDQANKRICRLDSRLQYVDEIKFADVDDPLKFGTPVGAALDRGGNLWVTDRENHRIAVFDAVQAFDRFIGEYGYSGGGLSSPGKVVVDRHGNHFVCDVGNKRIVVYDEYGNVDRDITDAEFKEPVAVTVDSHDRLWIVDRATSRIFVFSMDGARLMATGSDLPGGDRAMSSPSDIAFMGDKIVISDTGNDRLLICRPIFAE